MNSEQYQKLLAKLGACNDARHAANGKSLQEVWDTCERGDWLLWLCAKLSLDRKLIVGICCDIAEKTLIHVPAGEDRPANAIKTVRAWTRGEATIEQVRSAAADAYAYAADAYADAAASAAYASSASAYASAYASAAAADADASASVAAAYASSASAYAAASASAARNKSLMESANYVRSKIDFALILEAATRKQAEGKS